MEMMMIDALLNANMYNERHKRKTVGALANELLVRPDEKQGVWDTMKEMTKKFLPEIETCINRHKDWTEPFYVVVINKRERLMVNVIRQYFLARRTLPTPDLDQSVFKYTPSSGELRYLWTVPDKATVEYLASKVGDIPSDERQLQNFCKFFKTGQLDVMCGE
jgi:hypothetical protein